MSHTQQEPPFFRRFAGWTATVLGLIISGVAVSYISIHTESTPAPSSMALPTETPAPLATGLTPEEVRGWCKGDHCTAGRFSQLQESNGVINPNGILMASGDPVAFDIPAGISADLWDCFQASQVAGPISLSQVCQASFRRN